MPGMGSGVWDAQLRGWLDWPCNAGRLPNLSVQAEQEPWENFLGHGTGLSLSLLVGETFSLTCLAQPSSRVHPQASRDSYMPLTRVLLKLFHVASLPVRRSRRQLNGLWLRR